MEASAIAIALAYPIANIVKKCFVGAEIEDYFRL